MKYQRGDVCLAKEEPEEGEHFHLGTTTFRLVLASTQHSPIRPGWISAALPSAPDYSATRSSTNFVTAALTEPI